MSELLEWFTVLTWARVAVWCALSAVWGFNIAILIIGRIEDRRGGE